MSKPRKIDIHPPFGGQHKGRSYKQQDPFSSYDLSNVRPRDVFEGRQRLGTRPGLEKTHYEVLGGGEPIRLLAQVTIMESSGMSLFGDSILTEDESYSAAWSSDTNGIYEDFLVDSIGIYAEPDLGE